MKKTAQKIGSGDAPRFDQRNTIQQARRQATRAVRFGVKSLAWLDPLLVGMDRLFGYGKRVKTEEVWR